jgi:hypothetical protein
MCGTVVLSCLWFHFLLIQLPAVRPGMKALNEYSRNKQLKSFKLPAVLSSVIKVQYYPFPFFLNVNHPTVQCIHAVLHQSLGSPLSF